MKPWMRTALAVVLVLAIAAGGFFLPNLVAARLDRLHAKVEGALSALDANLVRRAESSLELANSGALDPASALLLASAAAEALAAESIDREPAALERIAALRRRCDGHPRMRFGPEAWDALRAEGETWLSDLAKPRARRDDSAFGF